MYVKDRGNFVRYLLSAIKGSKTVLTYKLIDTIPWVSRVECMIDLSVTVGYGSLAYTKTTTHITEVMSVDT
jgi:hypothetical protein